MSSLLFASCNSGLPETTYENASPEGFGTGAEFDEEMAARDNLDLRAVGQLLERSRDAEEFERLLNSDDDYVNNLDLNGDGYADYISVREFDDRSSGERGFSLFSMFGPELIQEIATIIFDRDGRDDGFYPGARVLLTGNEQLYGDDYNYETNWLERTVPMVTWAFSDRDDVYRSPYYYENYPSYYEPYEIVRTNDYRTRIAEYYPEPVFIEAPRPTVKDIRIRSPYRDRYIDNVWAKLAKPTKEQQNFRRENPGPPPFVRERLERVGQNRIPRGDNDVRERIAKPENEQRERNEKPERNEKFDRPGRPERPSEQPARPDRPQNPRADRPERERNERPQQQRVERQQPERFERQQQKAERPQPQRIERQQQKAERPQPQRVERQQPKQDRPNGKPDKPGNGGGGGGGKGKGKPF